MRLSACFWFLSLRAGTRAQGKKSADAPPTPRSASPGRPCFFALRQNQIRDHFLALGLRTKVQCQAPAAAADQAADQHWDREPEIVGQGEIGYDWWHQSAQYRPDVIAERRRGRPNLGREPFVHVGWYLRAGTAAEQRPLNDIADHDDPIIGAQHIKERY